MDLKNKLNPYLEVVSRWAVKNVNSYLKVMHAVFSYSPASDV